MGFTKEVTKEIEMRRKEQADAKLAMQHKNKAALDNERIERVLAIIRVMGLPREECESLKFDTSDLRDYAIWGFSDWNIKVKMSNEKCSYGSVPEQFIRKTSGGGWHSNFDVILEYQLEKHISNEDKALANSMHYSIKSLHPYPLGIANNISVTITIRANWETEEAGVLSREQQIDQYLGLMWDAEQAVKDAINALPEWRANVRVAIAEYQKEQERAQKEQDEKEHQYKLEQAEKTKRREKEELKHRAKYEKERQDIKVYLESLDEQYLTVIRDMSDEQLQNAIGMITDEIIERKVEAYQEEW